MVTEMVLQTIYKIRRYRLLLTTPLEVRMATPQLSFCPKKAKVFVILLVMSRTRHQTPLTRMIEIIPIHMDSIRSKLIAKIKMQKLPILSMLKRFGIILPTGTTYRVATNLMSIEKMVIQFQAIVRQEVGIVYSHLQ